jgi:hypothetical protein
MASEEYFSFIVLSYEDINSRCFHHYSNSLRFDSLLNSYSDLTSEAFLNLEPSAEGFSYTRQLGKSDYQLVGDVAYRDLTLLVACVWMWTISPCQ